MQATIRAPHRLALLIQAPMTASSMGIHRPRPVIPPSLAHCPPLPAPWLPVPGSEIVTDVQRFVAYTCGVGPEIHMHSMTGLNADPIDRQIAHINLGPHRVTVRACATDRFEAHWCAGHTHHRLAAGPIDLGTFMALLLSLTWE